MNDSAAPLSAGHLIVAQLEREGIQRVYNVPGESFLDVLDGLHASSIRTVTTRHEGGAGFMALTEGRLTAVPGVAMVTRGPGAANAFIAVHTAWQDATAMVLFIGLIPVADRGREAFQEFDLTGWFGSTAKHVTTLDDPTSAARVVAEAMHIARSGRPGPVVIGLPEDVIRLSAGGASTVEPIRPAVPAPSAEAMRELSSRLARAQHPLLVVGGDGWSAEAGAGLAAWAQSHNIPVTSDFRAYDAIPHRSDAWIGSLGYGRGDGAARMLEDADLLIFVGAPRTDVLSDGYTRGLDAETVLVLPSEPFGHAGRIDQLVLTDPAGLVRVLPGDAAVADRARLDAARTEHLRFCTPAPSAKASPEYVDLDAVMAVLREEMTEDAVITFGAGNHAIWPARYLAHNSPFSLAAPRNGAMGMGIPAAVAASLAHPGREVLSVAGDGCFQMNGQEIATAIGYGATFIALVVDNGAYGTIREHQEQHYPDRPSGTDMINPDFAALARAYGGHGESVNVTADFRAAYRRCRASGLPSIIHVRQDPAVRAPSSAS